MPAVGRTLALLVAAATTTAPASFASDHEPARSPTGAAPRLYGQIESSPTGAAAPRVQSGNCVARRSAAARRLYCDVVFSPAFRAPPIVAVGGGELSRTGVPRSSAAMLRATARNITVGGMTIEVVLQPGRPIGPVGASWIAIEP